MAKVTRIKAGDNKAKESEGTKAIKKMAIKNPKKSEKTSVDKKPKKIFAPIRFIFKPFIAFGRYIGDSWSEIRQVRWPNRKTTWKMVGAIFIYSAFFIIFVMILDALFNLIFSKLLR